MRKRTGCVKKTNRQKAFLKLDAFNHFKGLAKVWPDVTVAGIVTHEPVLTEREPLEVMKRHLMTCAARRDQARL